MTEDQGTAPTTCSVVTAAPVDTEVVQNFRWNAWCYMTDFALFSMAMAFVSQTTVMPAFVSRLTDSSLVIGLVATVQSGGWLLPQIVAAGYVAGKRRKRRYMLAPCFVGRPIFILLALLVFLVGDRNPTFLLVAFFVALAIHAISDALTAVPWFDILSKCMPPNRRGRVMGRAQIISGVVGIALGGVVAHVLSRPDLPFPYNYGVLFAAAGVLFLGNFVALALIREPDGPPAAEVPRPGAFVSSLIPTLRNDSRFARIIAVRMFLGMGTMVFPFYIVYARHWLLFDPEYVGVFLSAQVLGSVLGGLLFGQLADRLGTRRAIQVAVTTALLTPLIALVTLVFGSALGGALIYVTALMFTCIGMTFSSYLLGFMNHVLEIAPSDSRSTYAGLFNTLNGTLLVFPLIAGWFLEVTSYGALFALAAGLLSLSLLLSLRLSEPRDQTAVSSGVGV